MFQSAPVNSVALLDNIGFHKSLQVQKLAEAYGVRLLFTPPYSPECNPVENFFAVVKGVTRKAALCQVFETSDAFKNMITDAIAVAAKSQIFKNYFNIKGVVRQAYEGEDHGAILSSGFTR